MDYPMRTASGFDMSDAVKRTFAQIGQPYQETPEVRRNPIPATAQTEKNSASSAA